MSENVIEVDNTSLRILWANGMKSHHVFEWPIVQTVDFDEVIIIRVEPDFGVIFNENVFGILNGGQSFWRIESQYYVYADSPYTWISRIGNNVLLMNWDGLELLVDPMTGEALQKKFKK